MYLFVYLFVCLFLSALFVCFGVVVVAVVVAAADGAVFVLLCFVRWGGGGMRGLFWVLVSVSVAVVFKYTNKAMTFKSIYSNKCSAWNECLLISD